MLFIKKIDFSNFNTQNVTNMEKMLLWCGTLINIDLSNFKTQNVTNMRSMFIGCESLKNKIFQILIVKMLLILVICSLDVRH